MWPVFLSSPCRTRIFEHNDEDSSISTIMTTPQNTLPSNFRSLLFYPRGYGRLAPLRCVYTRSRDLAAAHDVLGCGCLGVCVAAGSPESAAREGGGPARVEAAGRRPRQGLPQGTRTPPEMQTRERGDSQMGLFTRFTPGALPL